MFFVGEKFSRIKLACLIDCGNYFRERKDLEKAIEYYRRALSLDPGDYYANIGLAEALAGNKSFGESLEFFQKATSIRKPDTLTLILMFIVYKGLREENLAKKMLNEIVKYFNNNESAAYDNMAHIYFELKMFKEAEHYINEALKMSPTKAGLHYNLGKLYFAREALEQARHEFQKALELASDRNEKRLRKYIIYYLKDIDKKYKRA